MAFSLARKSKTLVSATSACKIVSLIASPHTSTLPLTCAALRATGSSMGTEIHLCLWRRPIQGYNVSALLLCAQTASKIVVIVHNSWGESAGAISVALQMLTNGGNTEGLFRGGFMQSGSPIPVGDIMHGQNDYDAIVAETGCSSAADTLQCLREVPYATLKKAVDSSPGIFSPQVGVCAIPRGFGADSSVARSLLSLLGSLAWTGRSWLTLRRCSSSKEALPMFHLLPELVTITLHLRVTGLTSPATRTAMTRGPCSLFRTST